MARPVNADSAATRRRILSSAVRRFAENGAAGASIRDIARGAEVSLAMVHHYFGSKDELFGACVDSMYERLAVLAADLEGHLARGGDVGTIVERGVRAGFRFARSEQIAVRLLLRAVAESGELDETRQNRVQAPFLERASTLLGKELGRPARELRVPIQSVVMLVARYAVSSERELALITGVARPERVVEDHLVNAALALVGAPARTKPKTGKKHAN